MPRQAETITFASFAAELTRDYAHHWKPATRRTHADYIRRELLPTFGALGVAEVSRADVSRWRDSYAGSREGAFKRIVLILSVMLRYAEQLGYRRHGSNPCRGTQRYKRILPERFLAPAEYHCLGRTLDMAEADHPAEIAAIRLLLFTGARRGEIETLEWSWVKPDHLALPDNKGGAKVVYLNAPARAVLDGLSRHPDTELVFPDRSLLPLRLGNFWTRLRRQCALPDVRLHDLRHSFASTAIMIGVPLATIGRLFGHAV
ncbi:tyrosine-type recombinase/integrase [Sphingomonas bacterium]|uniref:tyrosine-type recombinase/integrase n=1 Tax=Sphingomonas bacterium TaxID=1895847 RepID=UPI0020C67115|nr:site-specific integrase [Sphingomonas bacterium]